MTPEEGTRLIDGNAMSPGPQPGHVIPEWTRTAFPQMSRQASYSAAGHYWHLSRQPLTGLFFILPFLIVYEVGVLTPFTTGAARNGADLWMRGRLLDAGVAFSWLFPLLVPVVLICWHCLKRTPWTCHFEVLAGMFAESLLFAMLLVLTGRLMQTLIPADVTGQAVPRAISFLGAGIYEELLFRLLLLPACYGILRLLRLPRSVCVLASVVVSSLLFSLAHYVQMQEWLEPRALADIGYRILSQPPYWNSFLFRLIAGAAFSTLFWVRGFGIAVGCHLLYDLIVGVVLGGLHR